MTWVFLGFLLARLPTPPDALHGDRPALLKTCHVDVMSRHREESHGAEGWTRDEHSLQTLVSDLILEDAWLARTVHFQGRGQAVSRDRIATAPARTSSPVATRRHEGTGTLHLRIVERKAVQINL